MSNKYIKSPINYTGNKYRILDQITLHFPKDIEVFIDLFTGGATVGFNINASKVILVDNNIKVIELLQFLSSYPIDKLIKEINSTIEYFCLTNSSLKEHSYSFNASSDNNGYKKRNSIGFYNMRKEYNAITNKSSNKAYIYLYLLMVYGFNNDIRFNSKGEFNLPVGKTDFNKNNLKKLIDFSNRAKEIDYEFICAEYDSEIVGKYINKRSFVYMDPPYLISNAVYNENGGWNVNKEEKLLSFTQGLISNGVNFALSNITQRKNLKNNLLIDFVNKNNLAEYQINYHYKSASYNKIDRNDETKEVLITNYCHEN